MKLYLSEKKYLYYESFGKGEPFIMLHGNGESLEIFYELTNDLKNHYEVILIDSPGHGKSYNLDELHYDEMANDILKFINKMNLKNINLLGYSDGGILGILLNIKAPDLFNNLFILGTNIKVDGVFKEIRDKFLKENHNKYTRLMINEPNIDESLLHNIKAKTYILVGEHDLIYKEHTNLIHNNIINSEVIEIKGHDHGSYICNNNYLYPLIIKKVKN